MFNFILGMFIGVCVGVIMMCCLQINRDDYNERFNDN